MSCLDTANCGESWKRRNAIILFGAMLIGFIILSAFSFLNSRGQAKPGEFTYASHTADDGKRVFQAFNCMGCHTMVGNGAYFAPDLTKEYAKAGPAWLAAFLPSAAGWPTDAAVRVQLAKPEVAQDAGVSTIEEYYKKFPGAQERVQRRSGVTTMPNLPISAEAVGQLIAYLKYTSAMNTEGWPPEVRIDDYEKRVRLAHKPYAAAVGAPGGAAVGTDQTAATGEVVATGQSAGQSVDLAAKGKALTQNLGCMACHTTDGTHPVGPSWAKLYGSTVEIDGGGTVSVDDAYLVESVRQPDAKVVKGFLKGLMPSYDALVTDADMDAIVAYIRSLGSEQ